LEAFPAIGLQKDTYRKIYRRLQGIYRRSVGGLQEDAESCFRGFEGGKMGGKGS